MQSSKLYIYGLGGKFIPQAVYMLTNIVLARLLAPSDFGAIGVLAVFFMIAETMMDAGLGGSLIYKKNITKIDCSTVFVFNLVVSHAMYFALFMTSGYIEDYFSIENLSTIARIVGLVFVINSWGLVVSTMITKNLQFKELMELSIISGVIASVVSIMCAICGLGVYALVAYQLVLALSRVVGLYVIYPMRLSFSFSYKSFKELAPFGIYTTIILIIDNIYENLLTVLFGKYLNVREAGYISQSKRIEESASKTLMSTINNVAFPYLSSVKEKVAFLKESSSLYKSICLMLFPLLTLVSVYSEEIITILLGGEWVKAGKYLSFLIYAGLFMVMESLYRNFIKSLGEVRELMIYTIYKRLIGFVLVFAALTVSVNWVLYAYVISSAIAFFLNLYLFCKLMEEKILSQFFRSVSYIIPCLLYLLSVIFISSITDNKMYSILYTVLFITMYYLIILPKMYKMSVVNYVKRLIK